MSLLKVKNMAAKLQDAIPAAQEQISNKYSALTDRQRAGKKGRDLKLDLHICDELLEAVAHFNTVIDEEE